jgi:ribosomal protein L29
MKDIKDLKLKDTKALKELDSKKLALELKEAGKKMFTLKMKVTLGEVKQTHLVTALRRYIARVNTFINTHK